MSILGDGKNAVYMQSTTSGGVETNQSGAESEKTAVGWLPATTTTVRINPHTLEWKRGLG